MKSAESGEHFEVEMKLVDLGFAGYLLIPLPIVGLNEPCCESRNAHT
jgi:predicted aspartyl protease